MADQETDPGFPSGPWNGFYTYRGHPDGLHRMGLGLAFVRGHLRGHGSDDIGPFHVAGGYELDSRRCWWVKTYPGSHEVYYRGVQHGRVISGDWALPPADAGTFRIWPGGAGGLDEEFFLVETAPAPEEEPALAGPLFEPGSLCDHASVG